jgi:HlyD family secretion protein
MKKIIFALVVLAAALAAGWSYFYRDKGNSIQFRTEKVTRGDIRATVTATGTLNAVTTVLVGTQVSGTIKEIFVDFNAQVRQGQLLAQIDPALPQAKVAQARANLLSAEAGVEKAESALREAQRVWERNRTLFARDYIARSELDTAETNAQSAAAQLKVSQAQVAQARAALQQEETNLRYTQILSPVNGTVISRNVDIGQTVAASFQTPTLFNIAEDLTRMQVETSVDEADIGRVRVGQAVEFTVDAYPDQPFSGRIHEIRNAPTTVQNVVTYNVIVRVANPNLKLKPGMTANVSIITAVEKAVLKIPNAALRFKWTPAAKTSDSERDRGKGQGKGQGKGKGEGRGDGAARPAKPVGAAAGAPSQMLWILEERTPRRVMVKLGISDGNETAVLAGELLAGAAVIVGTTGNTAKEAPPLSTRGFF